MRPWGGAGGACAEHGGSASIAARTRGAVAAFNASRRAAISKKEPFSSRTTCAPAGAAAATITIVSSERKRIPEAAFARRGGSCRREREARHKGAVLPASKLVRCRLAGHVVVERVLDHAEPEDPFLAEGDHRVINLLELRVLGRRLSIHLVSSRERGIHNRRRKRQKLGARSHQLAQRLGI